jgi:hypothetical protein
MGRRRWPVVCRFVSWSETGLITRGEVDGLPALSWGWAARNRLATRRQLRALGLRPGGQEPVAVLMFQHTRPGRRIEYARLYLIDRALPKREATPAQLAAVAKALAARRTCTRCGQVRDYYLSTVSRMCGPCEDRTDFWRRHASEHGWDWGAAA